ncbi:glyoxylase I family protein [Mariprofundus micogutta]|uniref:Glyoxylase I family protein n=1 Tax=Mariprofundus micogutta TaxID=1921010 RepID=A0A1L8CME6_9PROT|nr:VOC family protein [Mariprofundus micogutta]GAV20075.1 glyoxylase I family protein [Mariprofundus micogutta]
MQIKHVGLIVSDLEQAAEFYEGILGLQRIKRPELGFAGLWYGLEEGQQIHLMQLDDPYADCNRPAHGGRDHHVALMTDHFDAIRAQLESAGIDYTMSKSGRDALFCRDPDNNTIELFS